MHCLQCYFLTHFIVASAVASPISRRLWRIGLCSLTLQELHQQRRCEHLTVYVYNTTLAVIVALGQYVVILKTLGYS